MTSAHRSTDSILPTSSSFGIFREAQDLQMDMSADTTPISCLEDCEDILYTKKRKTKFMPLTFVGENDSYWISPGAKRPKVEESHLKNIVKRCLFPKR